MLRSLYRKAARAANRVKPGPPLVFLHVPKTGGTSLEGALARLYPPTCEGNIRFNLVTQAWRQARNFMPEGQEEDLTWFQTINTLLCYKIASGAPYLSGHFAVSQALLDAARPTYRFVTLLRDPVSRWKSNYVYSRIREAQDGVRTPPVDIAGELQDYLESSHGRKEGAKYIRYFGGYKTPDQLDHPRTIDNAVRLVRQFDLIGRLEDLPSFERGLSNLLGRPLRVPHLRKTETFQEPGGRTSADYQALFTPAIIERVRILCRPDITFINAVFAQ